MEELYSFDLLKIKTLKPKEYLLTMNVNDKRRTFTVYVEMTEPIFGVNFSDDFIYLLRNYQTDIRQLVGIVKKYYYGAKIDLPMPLLIEKTIPELQAA